MCSDLDKIPLVDIDSAGVYKYILIKVHGPVNDGVEPNITIVRGYKRANWHADIFDEVQGKLNEFNLDCECIGGGRIEHKPDEKKLHIYGYSQGYGRADHEITAQILKGVYKDYTISISNEGY